MSFIKSVARNVINNFANEEMMESTIVAVLVIVALLAVYEFLVYRFILRRSLYNKAFNICISIIPFFISTIILCLQSNLVITLGTIGALAIIRFRTAVKDPVDMVFIFWAIHIGITCGCQLYELAVLTSIIVTIVLVAMNHISFGTKAHILVVHTNDIEAQREVEAVVGKHCTKYRMKSRNYTDNGVNLVFEIITKEASELAEKITKVNSVSRFSLMEYEPDDIF